MWAARARRAPPTDGALSLPLFSSQFKVAEATAQQVGNSKPPPPAEQAPAPQESAPGVSPCSIKVIGVGGGGGNTLNRMVSVAGAESFIDFVAINTDVQALAASQADVRMQIGDDGAVRTSEPHAARPPDPAHSRARFCSPPAARSAASVRAASRRSAVRPPSPPRTTSFLLWPGPTWYS